MRLSAEPKMSSYLHNLGIKKGIPISGAFELTSRCNFNCEMCYVHDNKCKSDPLSADDWLVLGRFARDAGTLFLLITGGEPLIRDDFEKIYLGLSAMGFMISINTNASLINKYLPLFKENPPTRINASLYAADEESYKSFCKTDSFNVVIDNIKALKANGIDVKLNTVITKNNFAQSEKILNLANDLGLHIKTTAYVYPSVRVDGKFGESAVRLSPYEAAKCTLQCERLRFDKETYINRTRNLINSDCIGRDSDSFTCRAGRASFWITSDGIMRACGMISELEAYPLKDGFNKAWETVKNKTSLVKVPKECLQCKYADICKVCPAMIYAETGSFNVKPRYVCEFSENIFTIGSSDINNALNGDK